MLLMSVVALRLSRMPWAVAGGAADPIAGIRLTPPPLSCCLSPMGAPDIAVARRQQIPLDRDKVRAAIRTLPAEYVRYMLADAVELLPPARLHAVARQDSTAAAPLETRSHAPICLRT